jgi:hypothetical protein
MLGSLNPTKCNTRPPGTRRPQSLRIGPVRRRRNTKVEVRGICMYFVYFVFQARVECRRLPPIEGFGLPHSNFLRHSD